MSITGTPSDVAQRRAIEALRSGVPNADAVRALGCNQPAVETEFRQRLAAIPAAFTADGQVAGIVVSGGFGSGKSHLLEYLEQAALSAGFVTSRLVISKETPLYDPARLFRSAVETARVPGRNGPAITEVALTLDQDSRSYVGLYRWANDPESRIAPIFPATLMLHERLHNDPELVEEIRLFWSGQPLAIKRVRDGLRDIREAAAFSLKAVKVKELAEQRWQFATRLIIASGFNGWVLLIDEVELVGRYSLLQRGRSYAELARWMGAVEDAKCPGLLAVAAITDDFDAAILIDKGDRDYIGPRLRDKGTEEWLAVAARAEAGMRLLQRDVLQLDPPTEETLAQSHARLREIHGTAFAWAPPDIPRIDPALSRPMRSYVRRWINEWDLRRLYPDSEPETEELDVHTTYQEDAALEESETTDPSVIEG